MSQAQSDVDQAEEIQTAAPQLPPQKKTKASKLWQKFTRDPPLGQKGANSTNPFAKCNLCKAPRFQPRGNAGLMKHLVSCNGISKEELAEAHQIAQDEGIVYDGKPEKLDSYVESSKTADARKRQRSNSSGSLHAHFDTRAPSAEDKKALSRALLLFVVMCNVSFEAVISPFFLHFVQLLRPLWHPPSEFRIHQPSSITYGACHVVLSVQIAAGPDVLSGRLLTAEAATVDRMRDDQLKGEIILLLRIVHICALHDCLGDFDKGCLLQMPRT